MQAQTLNDTFFHARRTQIRTGPADPVSHARIATEVNRGLARYETLKKVFLVLDEFTANDGSLTPTLKLRRKVIEERYRKQRADLYAEADRQQRGSLANIHSCDGFRRPARPRMRRTFLGEIERRVATREIFRPSRSHTLGMTSSANSSVICWKVLSPTEP